MLTLDENHIYRLNGEIYPGPSVTTVIREAGLMGWHPGDEYYLLRGSYVHEAMKLYFKGTLDFESLAEGIKPYVDSALEFISTTGFTPTHVELSLHSKTYGYCGTLDAWPLIDWKTGGREDWHSIQISSYYGLANENVLDGHSIMPMNVHLRPDGKLPSCEPYTILSLYESKKIFLAALAVHNWKRNHGIKERV